MPRAPQRRPHLRGRVGQVLEAALQTGANPFAQITRFISKPSSTKTVRTVHDLTGVFRASSLSKKPSTRQDTMDGDGSGNDNGLKETPVDDVYNVQRGPPDYAFSTLPYIEDRAANSTKLMAQHTFRMTSPYDCQVTTTQTDLNAGTGFANVDDAVMEGVAEAQNKARWFDFYAGMYRYYHVVSCRWHITIENQSLLPIWVHQFYGNEEDRPVTASNQDMLLWGDTYSHYVGPVAFAITSQGGTERNDLPTGVNEETNVITQGANFETGNNVTARGPSHIVQLSGEYRPGDFTREVRLDSLVENWTLVNTNPALSERLHIRIKPQTEGWGDNDTSGYGQILKYRILTRIEYLVEFKELKDGLKYPVSTQPITVTLVTNSKT